MKQIIFLTLIVTFLMAGCVPQSPPAQTENIPEAHKRIACIGDGITSGYGMENSFWESYPAQLQRLMGGKWQVKNFGVPNATVLEKGQLPYRKQKAYRNVLEFNPNLIVIMLGSSDTTNHSWVHKDYFISDFKEMVSELKSLPSNPEIFLSYPSPIYHPEGEPTAAALSIKKEIIPNIKVVANYFNLPVIDLYTPLEDRPELFPDSIHPNAMGARLIATTIYSSIIRNQYIPAAGKPEKDGFAELQNKFIRRSHRNEYDRRKRIFDTVVDRNQ